MARRVTALCLALAAAVLLAGCGGGKSDTEPTTTAAPPPATTAVTTTPPTLTSAHDLAACNELTRNLRIVSGMTQDSVKRLTSSLHPKELGERTAQSGRDLLYVAKVIELIDVPPSLKTAQRQFVHAIRTFAADFGVAAKLAAKNDLAGAAQTLGDRPALTELMAATDAFTKACGTG